MSNHTKALSPIGCFATLVIPVLMLSGMGQTASAQCDAKLLPSDGAAGDVFGAATSVSGTVAVVGAPFDDDLGADSGAAYLYRYDGTEWLEQAKLQAADGTTGDKFGTAVAVSGATILIGAPGDGANGFASGAAYLFDATTGNQIKKILPADGAPDDEFGYAVALSENTALVGAWGNDEKSTNAGAAYLFDVITGNQFKKLLAADGAAEDEFGFAVALASQYALVGAYGDSDFGTQSGSAYLFDAVTGAAYSKILPDDGATDDLFGISVAVSGTFALIGAHNDDDHGRNSGSAYLFNIFDPENPIQDYKLTALDGAANDQFGVSVALDGAIAIVGAPFVDDNGENSGAAYQFNTLTGQLTGKRQPGDNSAGDLFGVSVALSAATAIAGAPLDSDNGKNAGSAYAFDLSCFNPPSIKTANYFPLIPNSRWDYTGVSDWTYENSDNYFEEGRDVFSGARRLLPNQVLINGNWTWEIRFVGGPRNEASRRFSLFYTRDQDGTKKHQRFVLEGGRSKLELYDPPLLHLRAEMLEGEEYEEETSWSGYTMGGHFNWNGTFFQKITFVGFETVEVAAGEFVDAARFEVSLSAVKEDPNSDWYETRQVQLTHWHAASVGWIKMDETWTVRSHRGSYWEEDREHITAELTSFDIPDLAVLTIIPVPLIADQIGTFIASNLKPETPAYLAYSLNGVGSTYVAALNVTLDLTKPKQAGKTKRSDADGNVEWTLPIPKNTAGRDVWFQACQFELKTNVIATQIE